MTRKRIQINGTRLASDTLRAFFGPRHTWGSGRRFRRLSTDLRARIRDVLSHTSEVVRCNDEEPVFVLSAGWRSGSTLLQRMVMKNNDDVLIWGEPYARSNIHDSLLNQFRAFTSQWPRDSFFLSNSDLKDPSAMWVANLYPDADHLLKAHRSFYSALFAGPARQAGRGRWGFKAVRLTIDHATYLRVLYPKCKILLLYRNPRDAYRSYRQWGIPSVRSWPDRLIATPYAFGRNWAELTRGYLEGHQRVGALLVRYENLADPLCVERLQTYLGWPIPPSSAMRRIPGPVTGPASRKLPRKKLPAADRILLDLATGKVRRDAGYADA